MTDGPRRIQRQRAKGWRIPRDAIYVGRPTRWGNPWHVDSLFCSVRGPKIGQIVGTVTNLPSLAEAHQYAVDRYRDWITHWDPAHRHPNLEDLRGHDLACWCPLDLACHADVLLELANR